MTRDDRTAERKKAALLRWLADADSDTVLRLGFMAHLWGNAPDDWGLADTWLGSDFGAAWLRRCPVGYPLPRPEDRPRPDPPLPRTWRHPRHRHA